MYSFLPACKVQRTTITTPTWKISENFHYWRFLKFKSCEVGLLSETTQHGSFFVKSKSVHQLKGCHRSSRQGSMHSVVVQHVPKGSKARQKQHLAAMSRITKNVQRLGDIPSSLSLTTRFSTWCGRPWKWFTVYSWSIFGRQLGLSTLTNPFHKEANVCVAGKHYEKVERKKHQFRLRSNVSTNSGSEPGWGRCAKDYLYCI